MELYLTLNHFSGKFPGHFSFSLSRESDGTVHDEKTAGMNIGRGDDSLRDRADTFLYGGGGLYDESDDLLDENNTPNRIQKKSILRVPKLGKNYTIRCQNLVANTPYRLTTTCSPIQKMARTASSLLTLSASIWA